MDARTLAYKQGTSGSLKQVLTLSLIESRLNVDHRIMMMPVKRSARRPRHNADADRLPEPTGAHF